MGRSRGGLTSKIHALVDAEGRPIRIALTPGQAHDGTAAGALLGELTPGATLLADKAYDSNAIRDQVQDQGVWANIPVKSNRKGSFAFSAWLYRYRNLVERFFNKLKQFRGIATRYDKSPDNFLAAIKIVSVRIWIRSYESAA
jgi:transposase